MIEYCQVLIREDGKIIARGDNEMIATGVDFIRIFNGLGKLGWRMCGQSLDYSRTRLDKNIEVYRNVFYFMREVKDVGAIE